MSSTDASLLSSGVRYIFDPLDIYSSCSHHLTHDFSLLGKCVCPPSPINVVSANRSPMRVVSIDLFAMAILIGETGETHLLRREES